MSAPGHRETPEQPEINDPPPSDNEGKHKIREDVERRAIDEYADIDDGVPVPPN
jgi:hypothetical protein